MNLFLLISALVVGLSHQACASNVDEEEATAQERALTTRHPAPAPTPDDDDGKNLSLLMGAFKDCPCEILVHIFRHVSVKDLSILCCVNSIFQQFVSSSLMLTLSKSAEPIDAAYLKELPQGLVCLNLKGTGITDEGVQHLPRGLTHLNLEGTGITDKALKHLPRGLLSLNVSWCPNLTGAGLACLPPGLKKLNLKDTEITSVKVLPQGLTHLYLEGCWRLKSLEIADSIFTTTALWREEFKDLDSLPTSLIYLDLHEYDDPVCGLESKTMRRFLKVVTAPGFQPPRDWQG